MIEKRHKGALAELRAAAWLFELGYQVFRNLSSHGAIDIIGMKEGKIEFFDVKSFNGGNLPYAKPEAAALGIKFILAKPDGSFEIVIPAERPGPRLCLHCGNTFQPILPTGRYCSNGCRRNAFRRRHGEPECPSVV